jgi:DNA repair photolyase
MRGIIEGLRDFANPFSILTKGTLILRDLDLLVQSAAVTEVATNFSVGSVDKELWRVLEPGTPSPLRRLEAVRALNDAGVPCGVLMAPIVPFLSDTDESISDTVRAIADAGATHIVPIVLHLRKGGSREWFMAWLRERHPELVPRYQELYGAGAYAPTAYQEEVSARVQGLARRCGVGRATPHEARRVTPASPQPEQLTLT